MIDMSVGAISDFGICTESLHDLGHTNLAISNVVS